MHVHHRLSTFPGRRFSSIHLQLQGPCPRCDISHLAQVLVVGGAGAQQQGNECRDGVTPPMRDARRRMFANLPAVDPAVMRKLEEDLLTIAMVRPCNSRL